MGKMDVSNILIDFIVEVSSKFNQKNPRIPKYINVSDE